MQVMPVAGHDSRLLSDSEGQRGIGEAPGSDGILQALTGVIPLVVGTGIGHFHRTLHSRWNR